MLKLLVILAIASVAVCDLADWMEVAGGAIVGGAIGFATLPVIGAGIGVTTAGPLAEGLFAAA